MVGMAMGTAKSEHAAARADAPEFEKVIWHKDPNLRKLYFWACILCVASATTGYDGMMMNSSQQMDRWQNYFNKPDDNRLGIMNNAYNIGSIISFFIVPFYTQWLGRKIPIATGCVIMCAGALVSTFSTNWKVYMAGRLVLGFGNSFAQMCSPILLTEICHPQHRAVFTAVYNCLWNLGALFVAWVAWGTSQANNEWSWRSITLLQALPSVIQLAFIFWVPESPRWLISKERYDEALDMLAYYHANGDRTNATVQYEYQEMRDTIRMDSEANRNSSYMDFFKTKGNRWRLAILISLGIISQYSGNALFSNYINLVYTGAGITNQSQKMALSGGERILYLAVSIYAATLIDKVGRRPLFLIATVGMVFSFICWTITCAIYENSNGTNSAAGYAQIPFVWIFGVCYAISWSGLLIAYALEILPYHLRAKGLTIMNITVQAILAIGGQTNPVAWKRLPKHWNLALFYTLWITVELIWVYFVYPETKGPTLEEIGRIFDGSDAVVQPNLETIEKEIQEERLSSTMDEKNPRIEQTRV
ncbi:hexose transporter-like protein [Cucurbitaria berberidis CBS 394.84]|uniref:Hexose transporter-like protein n=1 Tax=Cucurbitaria berberidis CBS 394.84 TaxID=1168544 RepID=A0A9P4GQ31_9PLEO|nr:hexose transporter-like protein [Cucurbitaria berberidis CBS 394.84]KAF1849160.1 hexose transporter-like protein [Cucurbitaria berberidis CBS 394.84]